MKRYNPKDIEPKWQKIWHETSTYSTDLDSDKPKYMAMSMFNYPSGAGIHIGHAMTYTISDVKARFMRQRGYESYHPVGWDAFGLPAENYAIKAGVSPQESMATIIPSYHKQYQAMGWSNDWDKEIATHLPEYYKWTQWLFVKMYEAGLAYQDSRDQWWCTKCQTVLANEQVIEDKCWRHDGFDDPIVEKKEISQWFFKITEYAEELLDAVDNLDWTPSVKQAQKNWIGRSEGARLTFDIVDYGGSIAVFTTAHDTIYGATFMVLAPEHELVSGITTEAQRSEVEAYVSATMKKTEVERQANKEKTGVFTGAYAINPANGEKIPVWIADYVLAGYGTGAVMAVPGEDERDHEFAQTFNLPIIYTTDRGEFTNYQHDIKGNLSEYTVANSAEFSGMTFAEARPAILEKLTSSNHAQAEINYKMRDWSVSRQRYWGAPIPAVYCSGECGVVVLGEKDLPVVLPELTDFQPSGDGRSALARAEDWLSTVCPNCGAEAERETDTLDTYVCSSWYMMRYLDPRNQQQIFDPMRAKKWMPTDFYNGADHATAHLLYARFIARFLTDQGYMDDPEPFKQMLYNGKVTAADGTMFSKSKGNGVDPLEIINQGYGADALRTYLMFAAPLEQWAKWNPQGVPGVFRFLGRVWNLVQEYHEANSVDISTGVQKELRAATAKMAQKVTKDIKSSQYNTAISACMAGLNDLSKLWQDNKAQNDAWKLALEKLVMCIGPFAPHIAEELWHQLGHNDSVHVDHWPVWNEADLRSDTITLAVQVNGKVRAEIHIAIDADEAEIKIEALAQENVQAHLNGKEPKKVIYVKNRLVSVVA